MVKIMSGKPEIVSSGVGYHNSDLAKTSMRLIEGGSWKKQRIIVLIPAAQTMASKVALAHWALMFPPNQAVHRMLCTGMEVGDAYSTAIEEILKHPDLSQWEYLLTIESDNVPQPDGVIKLLTQMEKHPEFACIGGLYFCKGPNGCAHLWGDITDKQMNFRPQVPRPGELMEVWGTSMGFNLWRLQMFKDERLRKPWFKTLNGSEGTGIGTQDLAFWGDAKKHGYRCAVDCAVPVGHHDLTGAFGPADFLW
jgi:hypothetical protein